MASLDPGDEALPEPAPDGAAKYKRVGWMSAIYLIGAFVSKIAKFLLVPFYVRMLTKTEVGMVVFLEALIFALARFFPLGLNQSVKRYYADFDTELEADRYTAGMWWIVLGVSLTWAVLAWATGSVWNSWIDDAIPAQYLVLAVAVAALGGNAMVPAVRFVARQQPIGHTLYTTGQFMLSTTFIVVLVWKYDMGVAGVLWGQLFAYVLWSVLSGVLVNGWAQWRPRFTLVRASFLFSIAVVPHLLFTWGITFADRLILVRWVELADVAIYGIGYQIGSLITIFSLSVTNAWLARFFRASDGEEGASEYARTLTRMTLALLWLSLGTFILAPELIGVAATTEYLDSVSILRVIAIAHVFHGLNQAFILPLFLQKATGKVSASTGLGLAANVALNLLLIPRIGIYGAAIATLAAYVVIAASSYRYARRVYPIRFDLRRVGLATALGLGLGAAALGFDTISLFDTGMRLILVLAYPAVLWAWPGHALLSPEDREVARSAVLSIRRRLGLRRS